MVWERTSEAIEPLLLHGASSAGLERKEPGTLRNAEPGLSLYQLTCGTLRSQHQTVRRSRGARDRAPC
ncbi:unnamed protein product [Pleuronectes platessa]|uniref:Uncharacterized protein n=1 Tax=Pleuronectes platessa TaxID=8262 RepID=A0A9N7UD82_PLEPL|nr:unnamed protein product [Pleuronectes platessa]